MSTETTSWERFWARLTRKPSCLFDGWPEIERAFIALSRGCHRE